MQNLRRGDLIQVAYDAALCDPIPGGFRLRPHSAVWGLPVWKTDSRIHRGNYRIETNGVASFDLPFGDVGYEPSQRIDPLDPYGGSRLN